jgi:hypothetical protein
MPPQKRLGTQKSEGGSRYGDGARLAFESRHQGLRYKSVPIPRWQALNGGINPLLPNGKMVIANRQWHV